MVIVVGGRGGFAGRLLGLGWGLGGMGCVSKRPASFETMARALASAGLAVASRVSSTRRVVRSVWCFGSNRTENNTNKAVKRRFMGDLENITRVTRGLKRA